MACNVSMHQSWPSADGHRITQHAGPPVSEHTANWRRLWRHFLYY